MISKLKYSVLQEPDGVPNQVGIVHENDYPTPFITYGHEGLMELVLFMNDEESIKSMFSRCKDPDILKAIFDRFGISI